LFQGFSQGFVYEHIVEDHAALQSQEENRSMSLENEVLETEFIQPNPTSAPTTMESLLLRPLYKGCQLSTLQSNILLLNLQTLHQWSNESMDDLFR
jgi:hypothetical protein